MATEHSSRRFHKCACLEVVAVDHSIPSETTDRDSIFSEKKETKSKETLEKPCYVY
jgi:hypothetical protein